MIECVWSEGPLSADNRAHYALATLVNNALDKAALGLVHRNGFRELAADASGAVVIIHGGHEAATANEVVANVARLRWAVSIVIGDEEGVFPAERLAGPRKEVWIQMPVPAVHGYARRRIICGYPHDCPAYLELCHDEMRDKPLGWMFAGQVNHASRRACVAQLKMMHNGFLYESARFWHGLPRDEYYRKLASCKVAPCPAGAATPDTLRVAEALEGGCVPVVEDKWPPNFPRRCGCAHGLTGYWRYVLGEEPPFPTLTNWQEFPALYEAALREWPANRDRLQVWWKEYKGRMAQWLTEDVNAARI